MSDYASLLKSIQKYGIQKLYNDSSKISQRDNLQNTLTTIHDQLSLLQNQVQDIQTSISGIDINRAGSQCGGITQHEYEDDCGSEVSLLGVFDGVNMITYDKRKFPVQKNYASKSKLVPGDKLKLKILSHGQFVYKLIAPVARGKVLATLSKDSIHGNPIALSKQGTFILNTAAVTYFQANIGDQILISFNKNRKTSHAAIESVIKKIDDF